MNKTHVQPHLSDEIYAMLGSRRSLMLSTLDQNNHPYASYAPFAMDEQSFYVLLSDMAVHGINLLMHPEAGVLIIEDEDTAGDLFARKRVMYQVKAESIPVNAPMWSHGIATLTQRHGKRIVNLSQLSDFRLFRLIPLKGRYIKGFGMAYQISPGTLSGSLEHISKGHLKR